MINNSLQLKINVNTNPQSIWNVLTNEEEFSKCFNGLQIECSQWEIGGKIIFRIEGTEVYDDAIITEFEKNVCLSYHYFKSKSTNFIDMSFRILNLDENICEVLLVGNNFMNAEEYEHSKLAWTGMLKRLKDFLENNI